MNAPLIQLSCDTPLSMDVAPLVIAISNLRASSAEAAAHALGFCLEALRLGTHGAENHTALQRCVERGRKAAEAAVRDGHVTIFHPPETHARQVAALAAGGGR
jgi:hypothetical protein